MNRPNFFGRRVRVASRMVDRAGRSYMDVELLHNFSGDWWATLTAIGLFQARSREGLMKLLETSFEVDQIDVVKESMCRPEKI